MLSNGTKEEIRRFSREEAGGHLSDAELSYLERLGRKSGRAKEKLRGKMTKLKPTSDRMREAREDLAQYMEDYVADLVSRGQSEEEALNTARKALAAGSKSEQTDEIKEKYMEYWQNRDLAADEIAGLYFAGFTLLGMTLGAIFGLLAGPKLFDARLWVCAAASAGVGLLLGVSVGLLKYASLLGRRRK